MFKLLVKTFDEDVHNNVIGTINILNAAAKTKVKKIIFAKINKFMKNQIKIMHLMKPVH